MRGERDAGFQHRPYGYAEEMRHFVDCVANNKTPRETFEDGYVVNCVLDAAYRSMQSKQRERVELTK